MGKRVFPAAAAALLVTAFAAIGQASGSPVPKYDRVTGNGQRAGFGSPATYAPTFSIDVKSGPSGEGARGTMTIDWGRSWVDAPHFGAPYSTTIDVTNLCVSGDTATIVGLVTSGTNATVGDPFITMVRDGGHGGKADGVRGIFTGWGYFSDPIFTDARRTLEEVCHDPFPPQIEGLGFVPLVSGNINVTDATS